MPRKFSDEQRLMIREFAGQGKSHVEIAAIMKERFPAEWTSPNANRTIAKILKGFAPSKEMKAKTLDEMTREERFKFIEARLQTTPRFLMAFRNFSVEDKAVFVDEYLSVMKSTETLTEVEEQALFTATLHLILALKALNRKEMEEQWRDQSLSGEIREEDPRFRRIVDKKYQDEYDQNMKLYSKAQEQLKMSRKDRLKEVRSQKQTLLDLADSLSSKEVQSEVSAEVERLSKLKDEELKRLHENGHLYGVFGEYE